jgi:hypothetical protein
MGARGAPARDRPGIVRGGQARPRRPGNENPIASARELRLSLRRARRDAGSRDARIGYSSGMAAAPTSLHLDVLNVAQRRAASHGEPLPENKGLRAGPLLIIAGAGTGKTATLAHRVAHLVLHGVDPARIMLLTFSRRAAIEMRRRSARDPAQGARRHPRQPLAGDRAAADLGGHLPRARQPAAAPLRAAARPRSSFTVIDRGDSADLLDSLRTELGLRGRSSASRARTAASRSIPIASTPSAR